MFDVQQLSKSFREDFWRSPFFALDNVRFSVKKGKATGFLGPNGAGKTTLIKILMGFISGDTGKIQFNEEMGKDKKSILSKIGFVPERPYFHPHLKGREFLEYMGKLSNVEKNLLRNNIEYYSKELGIHHALQKEIRSYSKGMLQRLGFVASLLHQPELLILDEPLAGLDPIGRRELKDIMVKLIAEGKTVFFSSHIIPDIEEVCEDVVVLEKGKIFYQGKIAELLSRKETPLVDITYKNSEGDEISKRIDKDTLNTELKKIIENNSEVLHVKRHRPTLEEIVYRS